MPKGYWVTWYRTVADRTALTKYTSLAVPVIERHGGRILARGNAARSYEGGPPERLAVIEFDSVEQAIAAYGSAEYQAAAAVLRGAAEREVRIIGGI